MRTRHMVLVLVSLIVLATQTGCSAVRAQEQIGARSTGDTTSHMSAKTDVRTCVYQVKPDVTDVQLRMDVRLTNGAMAWILIDPAGQVRWKGEAPGAYPMAKSKRFEPMAGEWKLKLAMADASGEYRALWHAE